ncbi:MAG TPA: efflux RND transporter periplasmic adaptor subunit [Candidatus Udaeobacter sp.]|jgi:membrane fusion protein, multidrug efflux system|nr:efflux RND transporter periplasmic adaptor subunit [Candidatus Udaeobacter sp.]
MTATEQIENFKVNVGSSAKRIRRGLNAPVLFGTFGVLLALFATGFAPRWRANSALANSVRDQRPTVTVISSQRPANDASLVLPGSTQGIQEAAIYARTNGYVKEWKVDIGQTVQQGQLLAEIETPEVDQQLAQTKANYEIAKVTAERWADLVAKKVVSNQEYDQNEKAYEAAKANYEQLQRLQGFQKIVAPFAGVITARNIDNGDLVSAGTSGQPAPLFRIAQTDVLRIYVDVPQTQSRLIAPGQSAAVSVREIPNRTFNAKVVRTARAIDPASRTLRTELQIPNADGGLFPGMYADVKFTLPQDPHTLIVPGNAVMIRSDGPKVLVVDAKNTIRSRAVKLGRDLGEKVEIISGLNPDESLVANPTDALREGTEVKAQSSKASDHSVKTTKG